MCGCYTPNSSPVLCGYRLGVLQFNSIDTNCLDSVQTLQVKGSVPRDGLALEVPIASSTSPGYPHFCLSGFPMILSSESIICSQGSRISGKRFTYSCWFIVKVIAEDTQEQSDEEHCGKRPWRVPTAAASGVSPSQHLVLCPPWQLSTPHCVGFLWRFHYLGNSSLNHWLLVINLIHPFLLQFPRRSGVGPELPNHLVGSSGNQPPSWSNLGAFSKQSSH